MDSSCPRGMPIGGQGESLPTLLNLPNQKRQAGACRTIPLRSKSCVTRRTATCEKKTPLPRSKSDRKSGVVSRAENMAVTNDGSAPNEERRGVTPPPHENRGFTGIYGCFSDIVIHGINPSAPLRASLSISSRLRPVACMITSNATPAASRFRATSIFPFSIPFSIPF